MNNEKDELKKEKKKAKSIERLKRVYYVIFILYIVLFLIWYSMKTDPALNRTIYEKVGSSSNGVSIPIKESLTVKELAIVRYKKYLINGDFENAYNMLSKEYKEYMTYDDYLTTLDGIDFDTFDMRDIKTRSNLSYEADIIYKKDGQDIETTYLLFRDELKEKNYTISPDKFVYSYKNQEYKKDGITIIVDKCIVYTDNVVLTGKIKFEPMFKSNITISNILITYGNSLNLSESLYRAMTKDEEFNFDIKFQDTKFFIPDGVSLVVEKGKKVKTYSFQFEENT